LIKPLHKDRKAKKYKKRLKLACGPTHVLNL